ncbi:MAG: hypothetical protein VBE63_23855 [Lamprobacter sp.]|uniref:GumC family protein n=1 Tax=Lamprobacter sp. TaxID=3100796 RepID=UPI002B26160B|nr:hypothetical protein [Lamprobacter sp.]MEA3642951.1 hypothetical protein [Lamprobacter sp.]
MSRNGRDRIDPNRRSDQRSSQALAWNADSAQTGTGQKSNRLPQIEVVTRDAAEDRPPPPARPKWSYGVWFLVAFALVAVPASLWNFSRPPVYRAAATVLTTVPEERSGFGAAVADEQHVAIQRSLLLGRQLLDDTLVRLRNAVGTDANNRGPSETTTLTADDLLMMLEVFPVPLTNLVELSASGDEPMLLASLVNEWLAAYQALREREVETQVGDRLDQLDERARLLEARIQAKRQMLDEFRERFDIVTLGRDSNQALKRLDTLQETLGEAEDASLRARARLDALESPAGIDRRALPERFANELSTLNQQAEQARAQADQLRDRYTELFIQKDPNKRRIIERLESIEARIDEVLREGAQQARIEARNAAELASRRVRDLQRELTEQKARASRFSSGFAEFEALQQDLNRLEEMRREVETQQTGLQTTALASYPQIEVIEPAFAPRDPISPNYSKDLALTLVAATAAGLITNLILLWLDAKARSSRPSFPVTGVRIWGAEASDQANNADLGGRLSRHETAGELSAPSARSPAQPVQLGAPASDASTPDTSTQAPRQLMIGEVDALWQLADASERQLIGLLLCGVQPNEAAELTQQQFDLTHGELLLDTRRLKLPPRLLELFASTDPLPAWEGQDRNSFEDLIDRLSLLAADAGIAHASEVNAATVRDTYLLYLVRQGARLTRLKQIAGPMSGADTLRFTPYSPAGAARSLDEIDLTYPILA